MKETCFIKAIYSDKTLIANATKNKMGNLNLLIETHKNLLMESFILHLIALFYNTALFLISWVFLTSLR